MKEKHPATAEELIAGSKAEDRRSQQALYQLYAPTLYAVALRYMGTQADAQDVLQESFIKIFRAIHGFRGDGSFEGWIRRIVVNTAIEHIRKKHVITSAIETQQEEALESETASALDQLGEQELLQMIAALPPGYRSVFNLFAIEGYAHKEIAELLQISEGTSKSQLARARLMLQEKIKLQSKS
ncbi:MAG: RNA polymerase sigma factor [Chitinophagaceae bacterium]